ncbi:hypothetical protein QYE76_035203 [Lolium multiflorum]|uniref:GDSL esterase/lipase n=1 Tax=Lolium multiflorum TaxID=4521 RepID=A0AAD8R007_LOLMU|nr:hypothetical protein QYE76_035203 [Lolium multiflorum]
MAFRQARLSSTTVALLLLLVAAVEVQMLVVDAASASKKKPAVPAVIVFGDSTVDTGNNNAINTVLKSNFPPYGRDLHLPGGGATGRFCNGRMPPDFVSEALGLPLLVPAYLDPAYSIKDFATGVVFASAGSGLDNVTASVLAVLPLWKEVEYFKEYQQRLAEHVRPDGAKHIVSNAAYIVSVGTNDILENYYLLVTGRILEFSPSEYSDFLIAQAEEFLTTIYTLGARRVTFVGLPAMGCLPLERTLNVLRGGSCIEEYNTVAREYNVRVKTMMARLRAKLQGFRLAYVDVYNSMVDVISHPEKLGLENVSEGCCATGKVEMAYLCNDVSPFTCHDADKYFFWDSFHPTEKLNRFFATGITKALLEII